MEEYKNPSTRDHFKYDDRSYDKVSDIDQKRQTRLYSYNQEPLSTENSVFWPSAKAQD